MTQFPLRPVWTIAREVRLVIDPQTIAGDVVHYSIPALETTGEPVIAPAADIQSGKLRLTGDEVLISRLNPRKSRVAQARSSDLPILASTEFVALRAVDCDPRFLTYSLLAETTRQGLDSEVRSVTRSHQRVEPQHITRLNLPVPDLSDQRRIADLLDEQLRSLDCGASAYSRMLSLRNEKIDALAWRCLEPVARDSLNDASLTPMKWLVSKLFRPTSWSHGDVVTAFRNGQVTARSQRRAEGYTEASSEKSQAQEVKTGDLVIHGLDGFAGAIGTSESDGVCSPAYHVCQVRDGDSDFYGRLLRLMAINGYLSLFGGSSRERAVDFRNWSSFSRIPIPDAPRAQQAQIGDMIRSMRPLAAKVAELQGLISERKQALITAAVTGQFDVTTARAVA